MKTTLRTLSLALALLLLLTGSAGAAGILPVLQTPKPQEIYAISLHSATGAEFDSFERAEDGGYKYLYSDVSYECYLAFSVKLGEEGYTLVSSETLEDGTSRAVVTDGKATLTMDYQLEAQTAAVSYPPFVYARDAALFGDYTEVRDGDDITVFDGIKATVTGWEKAPYYYRNDSAGSKRSGNILILYLKIDYNRPERMFGGDLIRHRVSLYDGKVRQKDAIGGLVRTFDNLVYNVERDTRYNTAASPEVFLEGKVTKPYAIVVDGLSSEQMEHPEKLSVTFSDYYNAKRYVYHFRTDEEEQGVPDGLAGTWKGIGTPKNGGTPIDLTVRIEADGSGEYTFVQGDYTESYPFTVSREDNSFSVDIPATAMLGRVEGTYEFKDGVLTLDITTTFAGGRTYSYTAECAKQE